MENVFFSPEKIYNKKFHLYVSFLLKKPINFEKIIERSSLNPTTLGRFDSSVLEPTSAKPPTYFQPEALRQPCSKVGRIKAPRPTPNAKPPRKKSKTLFQTEKFKRASSKIFFPRFPATTSGKTTGSRRCEASNRPSHGKRRHGNKRKLIVLFDLYFVWLCVFASFFADTVGKSTFLPAFHPFPDDSPSRDPRGMFVSKSAVFSRRDSQGKSRRLSGVADPLRENPRSSA